MTQARTLRERAAAEFVHFLKLESTAGMLLVAAAVLALVAACVYLSYRISVRILESKEF